MNSQQDQGEHDTTWMNENMSDFYRPDGSTDPEYLLSLTDPRQFRPRKPMTTFEQYRRTPIAEMRAYEPGETLNDRVSVSASDKEAGSPHVGDMIARNPKNHDDQWLVAAAYFADNFEPLGLAVTHEEPMAYISRHNVDGTCEYWLAYPDRGYAERAQALYSSANRGGVVESEHIPPGTEWTRDDGLGKPSVAWRDLSKPEWGAVAEVKALALAARPEHKLSREALAEMEGIATK